MYEFTGTPTTVEHSQLTGTTVAEITAEIEEHTARLLCKEEGIQGVVRHAHLTGMVNEQAALLGGQLLHLVHALVP